MTFRRSSHDCQYQYKLLSLNGTLRAVQHHVNHLDTTFQTGILLTFENKNVLCAFQLGQKMSKPYFISQDLTISGLISMVF